MRPDLVIDPRPIDERERAEVRRALGPAVEVPPPMPVARVQHAALPPELGLWRGYHELLTTRRGQGTGIHRLPDAYGGMVLLIDRRAADGTIARCRLVTFGSRHRLSYLPLCEGPAALCVMLPLAAAAHVLGVPAVELDGRLEPVADLWGSAARLLEERLARCADDIERIAILNRVLRRLLVRDIGADQRRLFAAVRAIEGCSGDVRIDSLAGSLGLGRRSLERLFAQVLGIPPKRYVRMVRLQGVLGQVLGRPMDGIDWTGVALRAGYCDQSHLIHDFNELCGMTPGRFIGIPGVDFTLRYGAVLLPTPSDAAAPPADRGSSCRALRAAG